MHFSTHSDLTGRHAFLSASKYHWVNYSDEKLDDYFANAMSAALGTRLHELAHELILLGIKLPNTSKTLNLFVNHAIGYRMKSEQILYYSDNAFGTADAVSFDEKKSLLRIFDLKNGVSKASMKQLEIYAAFFCLEYDFKPFELEIDLRIYQNDDFETHSPDVDDVVHIMDRIVMFDRRINELRMEAAA